MEEVVNIECQECKCVTEIKFDGVEEHVPFACPECGSHFGPQSQEP